MAQIFAEIINLATEVHRLPKVQEKNFEIVMLSPIPFNYYTIHPV